MLINKVCSFLQNTVWLWHRRRIKTEERAKVVPAVKGPELIQFLAALAISTRLI